MSGRALPRATAILVVATAALAFGLCSAQGAPTPPKAAYLEPTTVSPSCGADRLRHAACDVVGRFFQDVNSRQFEAACGLLGTKLGTETQGYTCPQFVEAGASEAMPWGILGARITGHGVVIVVSIGQRELDHIRMRHHRAFVGVERGQLRILSTRLVS
jgi:hypothetical protein